MDKQIIIYPIANGWIVRLPYRNLQDRAIQKMVDTFEKVVKPKSDIEEILEAKEGNWIAGPGLIPEDSFYMENETYFSSLTEALAHIAEHYK